jgi:CBS domain-containing protein
MNIDQLISPIPTLLPEDTGNKALEIMEENNLTELPVVTDDNYIALVNENDLLNWEKPGGALNTSDLLNYKPAVFAAGHPFEAMRLVHDMHLLLVPVVDSDNKYIGAVTRDSLLKYITENSGINTPGGIIVLEVNPRNYTLPEIARICENEDVVVLNLQVHGTEQGMLEITLKLNRSSLDAVVSSFERFNYRVKEVYGENNINDDIAGKYNLLMNYINM